LIEAWKRVARLAGEASAGGAALAVFPEAFLPAYPRGIAFGTVVGDRTAEGRDQFRRHFDASVDVPGPAVDRLAGIAGEHSLHAAWLSATVGRSTARRCSSRPMVTLASIAS
jgi:predicted amidohydrolase